MTPDDPSRQYFDYHRAALERPGNLHARRPLAALPARHRRQDRGRIHRSSKDSFCAGATARLHGKFKIQRAESGFPVFQNVLELENDRRQAEAARQIPSRTNCAAEMADFILRHKEFPGGAAASMAERLYLEEVRNGNLFGPFSAGPDGQGLGQSQ
jgi:hypothetical protein